jgi:polyhydroxyalkanoate synthesis regulator protein
MLVAARERLTSVQMARIGEPTTNNRYANRRLYYTGSGALVTLEHLAELVEDRKDFVLFDVTTGADATRSVRKHIIIERADHG